MSDDTIKGRVMQGEEAIGRIAQDLLENPIVSGALTRVFETRERAMRAQELAMGALNLPSAGDLERLTRRVRSVSQRLEAIEDGLDRLEERLARPGTEGRVEERLARIEALLVGVASERTAAPGASERTPPPQASKRTVPPGASEGAAAPAAAAPPTRAPRAGARSPRAGGTSPRSKRSDPAAG
jgi:hypothetical protein